MLNIVGRFYRKSGRRCQQLDSTRIIILVNEQTFSFKKVGIGSAFVLFFCSFSQMPRPDATLT